MENHCCEIDSTISLKNYKFTITCKLEGYEEMLRIIKNGISFESETFSVGPNKDILLKLVWNKMQHFPITNTNLTPSSTVSITCAKKPSTSIWLKDARFQVKQRDIDIAHTASFPSDKELVYGTTGVSCAFDSISFLKSNPKSYLVNGTLTAAIEGTIGTYKSATDVPRESIVISDAAPSGQCMEILFQKGKFSDVDIFCGGKSFSAHKGILWAKSGGFREILEKQENGEKSEANIISVSDISADVFKEGLHFIYTEKCPKLKEMAAGLLHFAEKFDVAELKDICEKELIQSLSIDNVCDYFSIADKQNADKLRLSCVEFIKENPKSIMATPGWKILRKEHTDMVAEVLEAILLNNAQS